MRPAQSVLALPRHIPAIDGLRGVAILLVVLHHFGIFYPGWAGVDVFFVISGFLITRILLRTKESPHYFGHFYARRALRILPLYYFSILLFFLVVFPIETRFGLPHYGARDFAWFFFHLSNWWVGSGHLSASPISHFWSLAVEEQFYLVWPLLVFALSRKRLTAATIAIALLSFSCRAADAVMHPGGTGFNSYFYTPYRIEPIAIGSLAAIFSGDALLWSKLSSYRQGLFWGGFTVWGATIFLGDNRAACVFGISAIGAVSVAMLIDAANGQSAFDISPLRHIGKYSYGLYVIHYPALFLTSYIFRGWGRYGHPLLTAATSIPLSYALARASYVLIESPFLGLKSQFVYEASSRHVLATADSTNS